VDGPQITGSGNAQISPFCIRHGRAADDQQNVQWGGSRATAAPVIVTLRDWRSGR
jgi:hypothetical protein